MTLNNPPPVPLRNQETLPKVTFIRVSLLGAVVLIAASWFSILTTEVLTNHQFFSSATISRAESFLKELMGANSQNTPAFFNPSEWYTTGLLAYQTLVMSVLAIGIAVGIALFTFMFGARNVMMGNLAPYSSWAWKALFFVTRGFFIITRAIPELILAMLIIFIFSPGILPGALALGLHNAGILGKLSAEVVEGLDPRPILALRTTGANRFQTMLYGVLPQTLPRFITYMFYRWEVIIRTTIVVGFVAAGGLGMEFRLSMSYFHYTNVTLILIWYLILVLSVDLIAATLRRLAN